MPRNKLIDLRNHLFLQMERLNEPDCKVDEEVPKAKAMTGIAGKIIDTGKVELQYMKLSKSVPEDTLIPVSNDAIKQIQS